MGRERIFEQDRSSSLVSVGSVWLLVVSRSFHDKLKTCSTRVFGVGRSSKTSILEVKVLLPASEQSDTGKNDFNSGSNDEFPEDITVISEIPLNKVVPRNARANHLDGG